MEVFFSKDIVLDDEVFQSATKQYEQLSKDIEKLQKSVEQGLINLKEGFQTPAGRKFINACEKNLIKPMKDQAIVISHVASNLSMANKKYEQVFKEYQQLNKNINNK